MESYGGRTIYWQEFLQHNDYDFYANYLAAKVDEDNYKVTPYTPSGDYQAISANSFKALGFTIKLPAATQTFSLEFGTTPGS